MNIWNWFNWFKIPKIFTENNGVKIVINITCTCLKLYLVN